jgi:hypothetical protein
MRRGRIAGFALLAAASAVLSAAPAQAADDPAPDKFHDVRSAPPERPVPLVALLGGGLLAAGGAGLVALRWRRARQSTIPELPAPEQAPAESDAGERLRQLAVALREGNCTPRQALVELDVLLRHGIERRSGHATGVLTAFELAKHPGIASVMDADLLARVMAFLSLADRVKFSGCEPRADEAMSALGVVEGVLESLPGGTRDALS